MLSSPLLVGEKIRLTAFNQDDLPAVTRWYQNADFIRHLEATPVRPKTEDVLKKWLEEGQTNPNDFLFALRPLTGSDPIGFVKLDDVLWNQQTGWLAVGIGDPANQGKGFGYEAMQLILTFAFQELNLRRVQLTVFSYNQRAVTMYEKLGFKREGIFREFLHRDGQFYDMYLYGLLRREWK
jgi:RimJ/RimL family protein N-acetyltransferase